jgi:hypothetical protein
MIWESHYWKDDLLESADYLEGWLDRTDWTEEELVGFEKAVLTSAYSMRKLAESYKLSDETVSEQVPVTKYPARGKNVSLRNWWEYWELYDLDDGNRETVSLRKLCNQLIHSFIFLVESDDEEDAAISSVIFNSDRNRNKHLYRIQIVDLVEVMRLVGNEYPSSMSMLYDPETGDWRIEISR